MGSAVETSRVVVGADWNGFDALFRLRGIPEGENNEGGENEGERDHGSEGLRVEGGAGLD